jgi:CRISPR-associated protein Cst2
MALYSMSISARATLDTHSLNNEGSEGNQIQTRLVTIVDQEGNLRTVNAISGDMFKHIQARHLWRILRESDSMPLCAGCQTFNANRIAADAEFMARAADLSDSDVIHELLGQCAHDDIEGAFITEGNRSVPRKSVVEFGWVVGVPGSVDTGSHVHVKYAAERSAGQRRQVREATQDTGSNLGQTMFYRPASSGVYAAVCHLELARIGLNDIAQTYAIDADQRQLRMRALLQSVLYTFIQPDGAMRSVQAPHVVGLSGMLTYSTGTVPAPTVSPLNDQYRDQIEALGAALERIAPGQIGLERFDTLSEFADAIQRLLQAEPYTLRYA